MSALNRAWQGWQKWCFGAVDPRRLAMLRIGWALLAPQLLHLGSEALNLSHQ